MPAKHTKLKSSNNLLFFIFIVIAAFLVLFSSKLPQLKQQILPGAKPTPNYSKYPPPQPIAQGKQVYNVSRGAGSKGPDIRQVTIDPFDPKKGEKQTISVKVQNNNSVNAVNITLKTDYKSEKYPLKLATGTDKDGIWEGEITTSDTHDYVYMAILEADSNDKSKVELSFR